MAHHSSSFSSTLGFDKQNKTMVTIEGVKIYAEYIEKKPGISYVEANNRAIFAGAQDMGMQDWGAENAIIGLKDNKIYLIDTETDKNYIPAYYNDSHPKQNSCLQAMAKIKQFNFALTIPAVKIDLKLKTDTHQVYSR